MLPAALTPVKEELPPSVSEEPAASEVDTWRNSWHTPKEWKQTWQTLWAAYNGAMQRGGKSAVSLDLMGPSGMSVPFEVQTVNGLRGVYSLRKVKKGEMVWFSGGRVISITSKGHYSTMLESLPQHLAHSMFMWSWVFYDPKIRKKVIRMTLDEGSLVNHAAKPNTGTHPHCDRLPEVARLVCLENNYALRDIEAGEEFTDNYNNYDEEDSLPWLDKLEEKYGFKEDERYRHPQNKKRRE